MKITTVDGKVYENKTCDDCFYKGGCIYFRPNRKPACDKFADKEEWIELLEKGMK